MEHNAGTFGIVCAYEAKALNNIATGANKRFSNLVEASCSSPRAGVGLLLHRITFLRPAQMVAWILESFD